MNAERDRNGGCLCGAVRFRATGVPGTFGVCHCEMCRRWTGSSFLEVSVPRDRVAWRGTEHIATRRSSDWGERAWCRDCGSPVWYRGTLNDQYAGVFEIPLGLFDDPDGFEMVRETFIDQKPDGFAFAGDGRDTLTRADCVARYPVLASDGSGDV